METKAQEGVIFDTSFVQRLTNLPISKREKEIDR